MPLLWWYEKGAKHGSLTHKSVETSPQLTRGCTGGQCLGTKSQPFRIQNLRKERGSGQTQGEQGWPLREGLRCVLPQESASLVREARVFIPTRRRPVRPQRPQLQASLLL